MDENLWLVVGLGNPGLEYSRNRHNVGFFVVDLVADRTGTKLRRHRRAIADVGEAKLASRPSGPEAKLASRPSGPEAKLASRPSGTEAKLASRPSGPEGKLGVGVDAPRLVLAKPMTYMNLSGGPVAALARYYKVPPDRIVVVHDELDLPYGQVRAKFGGGEGGHNGVRSLTRALGTRDFLRVRFGIGRPSGRQDPADYVLSDFTATERKDLEFLIDRAADVTESIVVRGLEATQNLYHAPSA